MASLNTCLLFLMSSISVLLSAQFTQVCLTSDSDQDPLNHFLKLSTRNYYSSRNKNRRKTSKKELLKQMLHRESRQITITLSWGLKTLLSTCSQMKRVILLMTLIVRRLIKFTIVICRLLSTPMKSLKENSIYLLLNVYQKDRKEKVDSF